MPPTGPAPTASSPGHSSPRPQAADAQQPTGPAEGKPTPRPNAPQSIPGHSWTTIRRYHAQKPGHNPHRRRSHAKSPGAQCPEARFLHRFHAISAPVTSRNRHTSTLPAAENRPFCAFCDPATNHKRTFCTHHSPVSARSASSSTNPVSTVFPSSMYRFAISSALIFCSDPAPVETTSSCLSLMP